MNELGNIDEGLRLGLEGEGFLLPSPLLIFFSLSSSSRVCMWLQLSLCVVLKVCEIDGV